VIRAVGSLVVTLVATIGVTSAQVRVVRYGDDRLSGIRHLDILVDGPTAVAGACSLAVAPIQQAAVSAVTETGLKASVSEKASSWFHTVVIGVRSLALSDQCMISLNVELLAHVEAMPLGDRQEPRTEWGSLLMGQMALLRSSGLLPSSIAARQQIVNSATRSAVIDIARRVRAAQGADARP